MSGLRQESLVDCVTCLAINLWIMHRIMDFEATDIAALLPADFTYVDTASVFSEMVGALQSEDRIAVDTEADSLHHYFQKVCLIQITANRKNWLVDPLAIVNLTPLVELFSVRKLIFHGCDYDLRMLRSFNGFSPQKPVFDTMIASQLLGYSHVGLAALVEKFADVVLSKKGQKSDWSRRPLTPEQLTYAVEDTRYLEMIADLLEQELLGLGRLDWHKESCASVVSATVHTREIDSDKRWRIKGLKDFTRRQLAYVREFWHWREGIAQKADIPSFKIITNQKILDLSLWADSSGDRSLTDSSAPRLPRTFTERRRAALAEIILRVRQMSDDECPEFPKRMPPPPDKKKEIDMLRAGCAKVAAGLELEPFIVAPRAALESIARNLPKNVTEVVESGYLLRWQTELLVEVIAKVLPGFSRD